MEESATVEVVVGRVGRAHGLRGDVVVEVRTDEPDARFGVGATVQIEGSRRDLTVVRSRWAKGCLIVAFDEVKDRQGAEELRGSVLVVDVEPNDDPDDPDEFWDRRLRGLTGGCRYLQTWGYPIRCRGRAYEASHWQGAAAGGR